MFNETFSYYYKDDQIDSDDYKYQESLFKKALKQINLEKYNEAIKNFSEILNFNPNNFLVFKERGFAREEVLDYRGAIEDFSKLIRVRPNEYSAYKIRAMIFKKINCKKNSKNDFYKAEEIISKHYLSLRKQIDSAVGSILISNMKEPWENEQFHIDKKNLLNLAKEYEVLGNKEKKEKATKLKNQFFEAYLYLLEKNVIPSYQTSPYQREICIKGAEGLSEASKFYNPLKTYYFPQYAIWWIRLFINKERSNNQRIDYLRLDANQRRIFKLNNEGNLRFENGDYKGAIKFFSKLIKLDPNNKKALEGRAISYKKLNEIDLEKIKSLE